MSLHRSEYDFGEFPVLIGRVLFPRFTSIALKSGSKRKNALTNTVAKDTLRIRRRNQPPRRHLFRVELRGRQGSRPVISPGARIGSGLPILHAVEGMRYYGVDDLYNGNYSMYEHEILCPWEIKDEIVGTWS
jgi:hypothetical protein